MACFGRLTEALVNLLILDCECFDLAVAGKLDSENRSSVMDLLANRSLSPSVRLRMTTFGSLSCCLVMNFVMLFERLNSLSLKLLFTRLRGMSAMLTRWAGVNSNFKLSEFRR